LRGYSEGTPRHLAPQVALRANGGFRAAVAALRYCWAARAAVAVAGLAGLGVRADGLEAVLAEGGEVDDQVEGVGQAVGEGSR
jgi:hypothetical protein